MNTNSIIDYYTVYLNNLFNFEDRTSVKGHWIPIIVNFVVAFIVNVIISRVPVIGGLVANVVTFAVSLASLASAVRRLRDTGRDWKWIFIVLVPFIGWIVLIYFLVQPTSNFAGRQVS